MSAAAVAASNQRRSRHGLGAKTFPTRMHFGVTLAVGGGPGCPIRAADFREGLAVRNPPDGRTRRPGRGLVVAPDAPAPSGARAPREAVPGADDARGRHPRRVHRGRSPPAVPLQARGRPGIQAHDLRRLSLIVAAFVAAGSRPSSSPGRRRTSRAGSASGRSRTSASDCSATSSASRSASTSAIGRARSSAGSRTTSRRSTSSSPTGVSASSRTASCSWVRSSFCSCSTGASRSRRSSSSRSWVSPPAGSARAPITPTAACGSVSGSSRQRSRRTSPACASSSPSRGSRRASRAFRGVNERYREANYETVILNGLYFPAVDILSSVATAIVLGVRRLARRRGEHDDRHAPRVHPLPRELLRPRAAALSALQHVPLGDRGARPHHRRPRRGARPRRLARRPTASGDRGARPLRACALRLRRAPGCPPRLRPRRPRRDDRRARRPHGGREVDHRKAARALLRPARRHDHHRRDRSPRRHAGLATAAARNRPAGGVPLRRLGRDNIAFGRPSAPRRRSSRCGGRRRRCVRLGARRRATRPRSASAASDSRSDSGSSSPSPARSSPIRASSSSTRRPPPSTSVPSDASSEALRRLLTGRTAFIIAHRLSTIRSADLIVVLDHGRIVDSGTHSELIARPGAYTRLYGDWAADVA